MWASLRKRIGFILAAVVAIGAAVLGFILGEKRHRIDDAPVVGPIPGAAEANREREALESREEKAKSLSERMKKLLGGTMTVILCLVMALPAVAQDAPAPYVPSTYAELLSYYKEAISLAQDYQGLYEQAEASNKALLQANDELRALVKAQQETIKKYLEKKPFSVYGGADVAPSGVGVQIGLIWSP